MELATGLFIVGAIAAVAQAERKGVVQAMLSRPLVLGTLIGWALGDAPSGLLLSVPLELLWLGGINVGANLPDHEVVGTASVTGGALLAAHGDPVGPALATAEVVLLAPLAAVGRRLDVIIEERNVAILARAMDRAAHARAPGSLHVVGLLAPSAAAGVLAAMGAALGALLLPPFIRWAPQNLLDGLELAWIGIAAVAAALAVTSVRVRKVSWSAAAGAVAGLAWIGLSALWGGSQ